MTSWWSAPVVAGALAAVLLSSAAAPIALLPAQTAPGVGPAAPAASTSGAQALTVPPSSPATDGAARVAPVPGSLVRRFDRPTHRYGPGHRGVDLSTTDGADVVSPAGGTVTFAGPVAGRPVVVITHRDGLRSSLEPVSAALPRGSSVSVGQVVGVVAAPDSYKHCPDRCVHWGLRRGDEYLDPWSWLTSGGSVRLLPLGP